MSKRSKKNGFFPVRTKVGSTMSPLSGGKTSMPRASQVSRAYTPTLEELLIEGLTLKEACMAQEAIASCGIEGITIDKAGVKRLCQAVIKDRAEREAGENSPEVPGKSSRKKPEKNTKKNQKTPEGSTELPEVLKGKTVPRRGIRGKSGKTTQESTEVPKGSPRLPKTPGGSRRLQEEKIGEKKQ